MLQVALLDQLAAHAGMGAELQEQQAQCEKGQEEAEEEGEEEEEEDEWEEAEQPEGVEEAQESRRGGHRAAHDEQHNTQQLEAAREEGSVGQQDDGDERRPTASVWGGSSGSWWVAKAEARAGKITQVNKEGRAIGEAMRAKGTTSALKDFHFDIMWVCFWDWQATNEELAALMRVPRRPPPLLRAQLACRAAEAICRLYRGQGLGGAYGSAPCFEGNDVEVSGLLHARIWHMPFSSLMSCCARTC